MLITYNWLGVCSTQCGIFVVEISVPCTNDIETDKREREVYWGDIVQTQIYSDKTTEAAQKFTLVDIGS